MGATIRPTPTLIFSEEADQLLYERAADLGFSEVWPVFWETPEPGRTWLKVLIKIKEFTQLWGGESLIVIDTLSRHWGIDDENDNAKVEAVFTPLINIVRSTGCAVLLIHHTRKSGGTGGVASRGGSAIVGAVDIILELGRFERGDRTNRRRLEGYSRYKGTPDSLVIQLSEEGYLVKGELDMESDDPGASINVAGSSNETKVRLWLRTNPGWWLVSSVAAGMHMPERTVRDAIGFLVSREEIETRGTGKKGDPYLYSGTEEEPNDAS